MILLNRCICSCNVFTCDIYYNPTIFAKKKQRACQPLHIMANFMSGRMVAWWYQTPYQEVLGSIPTLGADTSQRAHDVKMTSYQRPCDITSHRRRSDVILTSCACWDILSHINSLEYWLITRNCWLCPRHD